MTISQEKLDDLLACPMCGGEAANVSYRSCDCCGKAYNGAVSCQNDQCTAGVSHFDTDAEAIAAWNRRAPVTELKALRAQEPVVVKGLEWQMERPDRTVWTGVVAISGQYLVKHGDKGWETSHGMILLGWFDTPEVAKAAAQADFAQRVLSCLASPTLSTVSPAVTEAVVWPKPGWAIVPQGILDRWIDGYAFNEDSEEDCALLDQYRASMRPAALQPGGN